MHCWLGSVSTGKCTVLISYALFGLFLASLSGLAKNLAYSHIIKPSSGFQGFLFPRFQQHYSNIKINKKQIRRLVTSLTLEHFAQRLESKDWIEKSFTQ